MRTMTPETVAEKRKPTPLRLTRRIGATTYKVSVHYSQTSRETMGDKILRLIENEAAKTPAPTPYPNPESHVPTTPPQPERGSNEHIKTEHPL